MVNLIERAAQLKNSLFEALEAHPALLSLVDPGNIYELAVPEGIKSQPRYSVLSWMGLPSAHLVVR